MKFEFTVSEADAGRRLDRYLLTHLSPLLGGLPPSRIQRLLRKGDARLNGRRAKAGDTVRTGDLVVAHHPAPGGGEPEAAAPTEYRGPEIAILHESSALVVVNKPPELSCDHGESGTPGLLNWAESRYAGRIESGEARPAAAHRLDRGTSGAVCLTLTAKAAENFRQALVRHEVEKLYWVLVWGRPLEEEFELEIPLKRLGHTPRNRPKVVAAPSSEQGQAALTRFRWLAAGPEASLLQAEPLSGRTHQIRAHCLAHGLPVVGDPRYGDPARDRAVGLDAWLARQCLHARRLVLRHPEHGFEVNAPLSADFERALAALGVRPES